MPYKGNPHPKKEKHRPLQDEIAGDALAQGKGRTKKRERQPEDEFMTDAMSNKVLLQARKQLEEVEDEEAGDRPAPTPTLGRALMHATIHEEDSDEEDDEDDPMGAAARGRRAGSGRGRDLFGGGGGGDDDDAEKRDGGDDDDDDARGDDAAAYEGDVEVSPEDEAALAAFMAPKSGKERTLADISLDKIKE